MTKPKGPLTPERLRELVHYDPETGALTRLVASGSTKVGDVVGSAHTAGYIEASVGSARYLVHRLIWLYVCGQWPTGEIDHINGNRRDNRLVNLQECTGAQNQQNRGLSSASTSGVPGVHWDKSRGKWLAHITLGYKTRFLGRFSALDEAKKARAFAKANLHAYKPVDPARTSFKGAQA